MTVAQAADAMGISAEAVRGRIRRGTIPVEREAGAVYVLMDARTTDDQPTDRSELVELLRAQVEDLRAERDAWRDQARRSDFMASAHFERTRELESRLGELESADSNSPDPKAEEAGKPADMSSTLSLSEANRSAAPFLVAGAGIAVGIANPLLLGQQATVLELSMFLLWVLPPALGLWLGDVLGKEIAYAAAEHAAFRKKVERFQDETGQRGNPYFLEEDQVSPAAVRAWDMMRWFERKLIHLRLLLPTYTLLMGLLAAISSLTTIWVVDDVNTSEFGVAILQGIAAAMFLAFSGLVGIGRERQRQEAAHSTAGGGNPDEKSAANRQAVIGLVGTIITAVLAFIGVLVQVYGTGGGNGG